MLFFKSSTHLVNQVISNHGDGCLWIFMDLHGAGEGPAHMPRSPSAQTPGKPSSPHSTTADEPSVSTEAPSRFSRPPPNQDTHPKKRLGQIEGKHQRTVERR